MQCFFVDGMRVEGVGENPPYHLLKTWKRLSKVEEVTQAMEGGGKVTRLRERVYLPSRGVWGITKRAYMYGITYDEKWTGIGSFHRHIAEHFVGHQPPGWGITAIAVDTSPAKWAK